MADKPTRAVTISTQELIVVGKGERKVSRSHVLLKTLAPYTYRHFGFPLLSLTNPININASADAGASGEFTQKFSSSSGRKQSLIQLKLTRLLDLSAAQLLCHPTAEGRHKASEAGKLAQRGIPSGFQLKHINLMIQGEVEIKLERMGLRASQEGGGWP